MLAPRRLRQRLASRTPLPLTALAWLFALAGSAWLLADFAWRLLAPAPVVLPRVTVSDTGQVAASLAGRHLMGSAAVTGNAASPRFTLYGVLTGDARRPGFAVLAADGGAARGVVLGQEVAPGIVLAALQSDRVELRAADGVQTVPLTAPASTPSAPPPVAVEH